MRFRALLLIALLTACSRSEARNEPAKAPAPAASNAPASTTSQPANAPATPPAPTAPSDVAASLPPVTAVYPWGPRASAPVDRLDGRFRSPPAGFTRVDVARGSFAEFLRSLPLQAEGAPVVDYRGNKLYDGGRHPGIVAVADIDIGAKDLQQCADAIIRLHAEWRYGRGERDITYRAVSGQPLSYRGYVAGDRAFLAGKDIAIRRAAPAKKDDHALFRGWLDDVFSWAGTASLERDGKKVASPSEMTAGDFFVLSGVPFGHAVLILDVAKDERGRTALLIGQSYMPAQSFQVLANGGSPWFIIEPGAAVVETPFWRPFPMSSLRRL
ncbi:MAG: hypothetical protein BGO98_47870 [Myxococcales bacterium 68-20]|nr:hypothetical protein [Myxococcales bacterium]OJY29566.1 MAG: hypothetical protein BGO98_47870 [Myxococcales bacterium 68-20]